MTINSNLHRQWQERQSHSIAKAAQRWRDDPKGQTLTKAERKRAKQRRAYEKACLGNQG